MYSKLPNNSSVEQRQSIDQLTLDIFSYLQLSYTTIEIPVGIQETVHTIFIESNIQSEKKQIYFVGHGFGGSSLMNFAIIRPLLQKGDVVLWEIRGMGISTKLQHYPIHSLQDIDDFYTNTINTLLTYFNHKSSTFICHSFSAYILLRFMIKHHQMTTEYIKQAVLLSPVGITPQQQDYKRQTSGIGDCIYGSFIKLGWMLKLSYQTLLSTFCYQCKRAIVNNYIRNLDLDQKGKQLFGKIINLLIQLPAGSQKMFFNYFEARVLPKIAIEPLIQKQPPIPITIVYGGQKDWVDKKGAIRLSQQFPQKIKLHYLPDSDHNIPFHTSECLYLFQKLFQ